MGEPRGVCMCVSLCVGRGGPLPPAWGRGLQGDVDVGGARARALPPVRKMARRGQARAYQYTMVQTHRIVNIERMLTMDFE